MGTPSSHNRIPRAMRLSSCAGVRPLTIDPGLPGGSPVQRMRCTLAKVITHERLTRSPVP